METVVRKLRSGARKIVVTTDDLGVVDAIGQWVRTGGAHFELERRERWYELVIYLLPLEFDAHPMHAWRPSPPAREPDLALVP